MTQKASTKAHICVRGWPIFWEIAKTRRARERKLCTLRSLTVSPKVSRIRFFIYLNQLIPKAAATKRGDFVEMYGKLEGTLDPLRHRISFFVISRQKKRSPRYASFLRSPRIFNRFELSRFHHKYHRVYENWKSIRTKVFILVYETATCWNN